MYEAIAPSHWSLRLLLALGLAQYLCRGVYLGLFSNGFDFTVTHSAAAQVLAGQGAHLYDALLAFRPGDRSVFYLYPPIVAVLFLPFGLVSRAPAGVLFQLASHAALWGALAVWVFGTARGDAAEKRLTAVALVLLFFPIHYSFQLGQSEPAILLCLLGALHSFERGRPTLSGLCLAVAICLKMFLLLLLLPLLVRREFRCLLWTFLWLALAFLIGCAVVPWNVQHDYWMRLSQPLGIEAFWDNQTVTGFVYRWLCDNPYVGSLWNAPRAARALSGGVGLGMIAALGWTSARPRTEVSWPSLFALAVTTALLASPHADTHNHALLLVPFLVLFSSRPATGALIAFYAFFASFAPLVSFKFVSREHLASVSAAPWSAIISLPFMILSAFWLYQLRLIHRKT